MHRIRAVPALAVLLAIAAIGITALLHRQESASRDSQLDLEKVKLALSELQSAPFAASKSTGGSPALARLLMEGNRREIATTLKRLDENAPPGPTALRGTEEVPGVLDGLPALMAINGGRLDQIYELGASGVGYQAEADRLAREANQSETRIVTLLNAASSEYDERAATAATRAEIGEIGTTLILLGAFGFYYRRSLRIAKSNRGMLVAAREEALTDALTGLHNRRALVSDLDQRVADVRGPEDTDVDHSGRDQIMLSLFDLDGFKQYNDTFGHPAGDALLRRLGRRFEAAVDGTATVYRMGGDEFCLLARVGRGDAADQIAELGVVALTERGAGFEIGCSQGSALIPSEAGDAEVALSLADERMYAQKAEGTSASRQSSDVLQRVLAEKSAALSKHLGGVGALAERTALALGLSEATAARVKTAAQLHDVGKTGIPDAILDKPAPLEDDETAFMQRHTVIGERILRAAPSLAPAAGFVRSHHERMDGTGYPDGLSGESIPIGARIIFACDAFDAMTSDRPYRKAIPVADALAELRRCSGTQFDPRVVRALASQIEGGESVEPAGAPPQPVPV